MHMPVCKQEKERNIKHMTRDKWREGERCRDPTW